jgi:uncharacterized protein YbjT (DUF2867 family)
MANQRVVLITGATGKQGGATIRHLAKQGGFTLRAMTRKPSSDAAKALAGLGVQLVTGDLNDPSSLERALEGAWGVFAVQNSWEAGVEKEEEQGKRIAELARKKGVQHFVYTSVGSAHKNTGIPHFDNKARVEQTVKALGFPSHVIFRPVFFMENLLSPWFLQGDKLVTALNPATKVHMIAVDDIGKFGALAFTQADRMKGLELDIAGDSITMPESASIVSEIVKRPVSYQRIPIEAVRQNSADMAKMLEWFDTVGYSVDVPALQAQWGIRLLTVKEWAKTQRA